MRAPCGQYCSSPHFRQVTLPMRRGRAFLPALYFAESQPSGFQNSDDLVRVRIHDHDLLLDEDELIPAPFRIDRHHSLRQRVEGHVARYAGADRNREVHVRHRLNALFLDHAGDLGALLGRALITLHRALAGRLTLLFALLLGLLFGLHAAAVFLALGLHVLVLAAFAAFRLHVLAALHLVFGALALFSARRLLLGLHVGLLICRATLLGCATARRRFTAH